MRVPTRRDLAALRRHRRALPADPGPEDAAAEDVRQRLLRVVSAPVPAGAPRLDAPSPGSVRWEPTRPGPTPPGRATDAWSPGGQASDGQALGGPATDGPALGGQAVGGQAPPEPAGEHGTDRAAAAALAAFDPGRRGVRALAGVVALVVVGAGLVAWRSRPAVAPVQPVAVAESVEAASSAPATVTVAVSGRVQRPGLVHLPAGARVADALDAAGGPLPGTDLSLLNLARKLVDGELVLVGVTPSVPVDGTQPGGQGAASAPGAKINLNTASLTELETLPGVGPVLAQRIVDYRVAHGSFRSTAELRQVDGIGATRFEQLKGRVTV